MKKRILLVGDDQPLWQEFLQYSMTTDEWESESVSNGADALKLVEQRDFDVIVAEAQLPGILGVELLDELMRTRPEALRIVLSDLADSGSTLQCVGKAHRHLVKPCDLQTLINSLNQALAFDTWLPGVAVQKLMPQMRWVPSPPEIYFQVISEMQSPDTSIERIGELIGHDPAITAKLLQLANSAVFGLQLHVNQPTEAVSYIGLETTKSLLLLAHTFASFENLQPSGFSVESLWRHSLATGHFARTIATLEDAGPEVAEQAFAAGLLHDIGKLLFAANLPKQFSQALMLAREQRRALWETETEVLGACHGQVGAGLLGIWGLPTPIIEAIAMHHFPGCQGTMTFSPLTLVHCANVIEHGATPEASGVVSSPMDVGYLAALGLDQRVEEWRQHCLAQGEAAA